MTYGEDHTMRMMRRRPSLPRLALLTTLAVAAAPLLAATGGPAGADAPGQGAAVAPAAPISIQLPARVEAGSRDGKAFLFSPVYLQAPLDQPFELWSHRPSYDQKIQTEWRSPTGPVALPEGSVREWGAGLRKFLSYSVTRVSDGAVVATWNSPMCLNSWEAQRTDPAAPARSPYPQDCPYNQYTLGSVQGVQAGWANQLYAYKRLLATPGQYELTVSIAEPYATLFGLDATAASDTARLVVVKGDVECLGCRGKDGGSDVHPQPAAEEPAGDSGGFVADPKPDLRALPAFGVTLNRTGTVLRFGANVWNGGDSPLVVDGFRTEDEDVMTAYQYFFDADGNQTGYQEVGEFHFHHANHQHWHFEDFARYALLDKDMNQVVLSKKQSFCLANTDAVDYTVPGADWRPENTDLSTACGGEEALSLREVLSAGSGDTYYQYRAGQAFPIADLPNGTYYIAVEANPEGNLVESVTDNNTSYRKIFLRGTPDHRRVWVPQVGLIDEGDVMGE